MVVNEEDHHQDNQLSASALNRKDAWPTRSKEMEELLVNKELKELKIERAEHKRRIEQLEDQNDDLLLELASLRMNQSVSSVYDRGGSSENLNNENRFSVITNTTTTANSKSNSNSNAAIPRRNSDAITFTRCSPHHPNVRRATVGVTTPKAVESCLSTSSLLRRGSSMTSSRRGSRRVTIASSSPYSTNSGGSGGGSGGSGGSGLTNKYSKDSRRAPIMSAQEKGRNNNETLGRKC
ncbi:hypothetical protein FRACYDRAFT_243773 [Fragilariopsis cylindrus CCMP1102]|uniref:Uncharacterized protein n=1 Tax=Fragilariopsis cylindrus CCMP1102 TaxID=635003 RepID=A0A1E7F3U5_9STRA|nr:hypothetical protein FRACYDRAFT_243773 [Fragilariopsis cylindrus CCMP1102]|eukprot:OEU12523.1 hypothetical protein FRACYDRAFT_243773 [Fragilariopsis cylindrus CCMP1102]